MLSGMSRHDEDEVEDELQAMEREMSSQRLPAAPQGAPLSTVKDSNLPEVPVDDPVRQRAQNGEQNPEPMLA
jgi:hypothetical protein